jgi:hypothetical protein
MTDSEAETANVNVNVPDRANPATKPEYLVVISKLQILFRVFLGFFRVSGFENPKTPKP